VRTNLFWRRVGSLLAVGFVRRRLAAAEPVIDLWPEGVPGLRADASPRRMHDELVSNVHRPSAHLLRRPGRAGHRRRGDHLPGGGYNVLAWEKEGVEPRAWFQCAGRGGRLCSSIGLWNDGQPARCGMSLRAVRLVRSRAAEFRDQHPTVLGVMGFSAGGHLAAACAGVLYDAPEGRTGAALDAVRARPIFSCDLSGHHHEGPVRPCRVAAESPRSRAGRRS